MPTMCAAYSVLMIPGPPRAARSGVARSRPRFDLSRVTSREHLLDHQLWCVGCDIRRGDGLPLAFGFERCRATEPGGATAYTIALPETSGRVIAWGFGLTLVGGGVPIFVRRHPFAVELDEAWEPSLLGGRPLPSPMPRIALGTHGEATSLFVGLCRLWEEYEAWVEQRLGPAWREANWLARPRRIRRHQTVEGRPLAPLWQAWRARVLGESSPSLTVTHP